MNTITDGCCIIDAICGIDTASPQVGQFTDNFTKIKFIIKKNLKDYNILLLTDTDGQVDFIVPDDKVLIKTTSAGSGETTLLWNLGREITSKSTVVIYQIVAYKGDIDNPESTWYSKEGRLTVTESIDSSSKSASVIGTFPNLLTRLILNVEKCKEKYDTLSDTKVDKAAGKGLSANDFTNELKEKLNGIEEGAEKNVCSDWNESDSQKDSYIKNKPSNFASILAIDDDATNFEFKGDDVPVALKKGEGIDFDVTNRSDERSILISSIIDKVYNPESSFPQSGKAVAQALASLADSAPQTLDTLREIADALNNDPDFAASVVTELSKKANSSELSKVATSGSYNDLTGKPEVLSEYRPESFSAINSVALKQVMDSLGKTINAISDEEVEIDELTSPEDTGIYLVDSFPQGHNYYLIVINRNASSTMCIQYRINQSLRYRYKKQTSDEWSEWMAVGITSYNDLNDKPEVLSEYNPESFSAINSVALKQVMDSLTGIVKTISDEEVEIDELTNPEDTGIYLVDSFPEGHNYYLIVINRNASSTMCIQYRINQNLRYRYKKQISDEWSEWKAVGVTSYNDLTDKPVLSDVAISGSYDDLTNKPEVNQHYAEGNELAISGQGVKEALDTLSAVAHSGKYVDLSGKPITVLDYYPDADEELNELTDGVYYFIDISGTTPPSNVFIIASHTEDWFHTGTEAKYKREQWTQVIIDDKGVRKRQKTNYRNFDDGTPEYTIDWKDVPLNDDLATKEYVDSCVGDVETSLENIITKYGLGGESI